MILNSSENYVLVLKELSNLLDELQVENHHFNSVLVNRLERLKLSGRFSDLALDLLRQSKQMSDSLSDADKLVRETLSNMQDS